VRAAPENPFQHLRRVRQPFDGLVYEFTMIDPANRLCEHGFVFQVVYSQDEETLWVIRAAYLRREGL
jgi:hypothetical protein